MFLEKTRRFFSIFPLISVSKPMKAAKNDFRAGNRRDSTVYFRPVRKLQFQNRLPF